MPDLISRIIPSKTKTFKQLLNYVSKENSKQLHSNLIATDNDSMAAEFQAIAALNPKTQYQTFHSALSVSGKLDDQTWTDLAQDYINGMGFSNAQYAVFQHNDTPHHQHVHIVGNRIDREGNRVPDNWNYLRSLKLSEELTIKHDLANKIERNPELMQEVEEQKKVRSVDQILEGLPELPRVYRSNINRTWNQAHAQWLTFKNSIWDHFLKDTEFGQRLEDWQIRRVEEKANRAVEREYFKKSRDTDRKLRMEEWRLAQSERLLSVQAEYARRMERLEEVGLNGQKLKETQKALSDRIERSEKQLQSLWGGKSENVEQVKQTLEQHPAPIPEKTVERSSDRPRWPKGSPDGKGGKFMKDEEIKAHPDVVEQWRSHQAAKTLQDKQTGLPELPDIVPMVTGKLPERKQEPPKLSDYRDAFNAEPDNFPPLPLPPKPVEKTEKVLTEEEKVGRQQWRKDMESQLREARINPSDVKLDYDRREEINRALDWTRQQDWATSPGALLNSKLKKGEFKEAPPETTSTQSLPVAAADTPEQVFESHLRNKDWESAKRFADFHGYKNPEEYQKLAAQYEFDWKPAEPPDPATKQKIQDIKEGLKAKKGDEIEQTTSISEPPKPSPVAAERESKRDEERSELDQHLKSAPEPMDASQAKTDRLGDLLESQRRKYGVPKPAESPPVGDWEIDANPDRYLDTNGGQYPEPQPEPQPTEQQQPSKLQQRIAESSSQSEPQPQQPSRLQQRLAESSTFQSQPEPQQTKLEQRISESELTPNPEQPEQERKRGMKR